MITIFSSIHAMIVAWSSRFPYFALKLSSRCLKIVNYLSAFRKKLPPNNIVIKTEKTEQKQHQKPENRVFYDIQTTMPI